MSQFVWKFTFFLCSSVKVNDVRWPIAPQTVSPNGPIKWWVLFSFFFFCLVDPSNRFFLNHCLFWYHIYWIIIIFLKKTPKVNWWNLTKPGRKRNLEQKRAEQSFCWSQKEKLLKKSTWGTNLYRYKEN